MQERKNRKIAFLDRDGVINNKAEDQHYITKLSDFIFTNGIFDLVKKLHQDGFEFIVITNQRGVSRGLYSEGNLLVIHEFLRKGFLEQGVTVLDIFYCPHGHNECDCRKPKDGMLREACRRYEIDLRGSLLISDSQEDIAMGERFGIRSFYVRSDHPEDALKLYEKN